MTVMPGTDLPSDPFDERLIEADALSPDDREFDVALRPRTLDDFVGQDRSRSS
jgi:Holliday junction resolvasome RuvABC ATP-dependent DNA helicase subunit